jgi:transposase
MPAGRPTKYDPALCERVIECGAEGMGKLETCAEIGIHYETFEAWQEKHPEFSEAVKASQALSQAWWEKNGRIATFGGCPNFNATSYIFQMKNRFSKDWRDKRDIDHSSADGTMSPKGIPDDVITALDAIAGKIASSDGAG